MKKIVKNIKSHKMLSLVLSVCILVAAGVGVGFGLYQAKYGATNLATEYAAKGYITPEEMAEIEASGELVLGEEIVDAEGNIVVLEKDANGNIVSHVVGRQEGKQGSSEPGHSHMWVAHYATRQVETGTKYVVDVASQPIYTKRSVCCCNECGQELTNGLHVHNGILCGSGNIIKTILTGYTQEQGHNEPVYTTEQYIDYYYCSECGARQ